MSKSIRICLFASARPPRTVEARKSGDELVSILVENNAELVFGGGGSGGVMGIVAKGLIKRGRKVFGVTTKDLLQFDTPVEGLAELSVANDLGERKRIMTQKSDVAIALEGGIGTLDEIMSWLADIQLGIHSKPLGIFNRDGIYDPLLELLEQFVSSKRARKDGLDCMIVDKDLSRLVKKLLAMSP